MHNNHSGVDLKDISIVLIADRTFRGEHQVNLQGRDLEMISNEYFEDIYDGLKKECKEVFHYSTPGELTNNIQKHKNHVVITIFGGSYSRNRMAWVPAICEANNIAFIGADTYARVLCQDKFLSKQFAKQFNIKSPKGIVVFDDVEIETLQKLKLPLVVKPNFEGSSIGISEFSKVNSYEKAIDQIKKLQKQFEHPIIIEEFINGKEISICVVGLKNNIKLFKAMEVYDKRDPKFLWNRIYSAKGKHLLDRTFCHKDVTDELNEIDRANIISLFTCLGKMDFMRIDGRLNSDGFTMIELTPDAYLGRSSAFSEAALAHGTSYGGLLKMILENLKLNPAPNVLRADKINVPEQPQPLSS